MGWEEHNRVTRMYLQHPLESGFCWLQYACLLGGNLASSATDLGAK